jgi:hypothetical protein
MNTADRWCNQDDCPAPICGGPHVETYYEGLGMVTEHVDHQGEFLKMFGTIGGHDETETRKTSNL